MQSFPVVVVSMALRFLNAIVLCTRQCVTEYALQYTPKCPWHEFEMRRRFVRTFPQSFDTEIHKYFDFITRASEQRRDLSAPAVDKNTHV